MEQVKFLHSWCITREQLGRSRITPITNFAAGYDSAAYVWTASLRLTRPNKNKQVNPMYIQLSRKDLFRSHPLIVTATVTSYDGLNLDNALGRLRFTLTQTTGVPSNWTYHFRNDAAAVRKLLTSGTCVIIDFQMFYHPLLLIRRISGERIPSPISPPPNDFRYAHLTDGDFIFECVDGRVPAQRHLLYVSSEYFRRQLDRNPTLSSHFLSYPKKLVAALVGYVHTLTFAFPESMRLEDVEPFLRLLDYFVLRRPDNAKLVSSNLREVVRCLCTAYEAEFDQVVIRACDLIVNNHYGNFEDTYRTDSLSAAASRYVV
ncbi:hypothetical protein AAVH_02177 [Aphelenchoides avenae]|nr:hypothetical protein AAVH_02177 [Aphelenchus avenae]